jgi:hypothetical protein
MLMTGIDLNRGYDNCPVLKSRGLPDACDSVRGHFERNARSTIQSCNYQRGLFMSGKYLMIPTAIALVSTSGCVTRTTYKNEPRQSIHFASEQAAQTFYETYLGKSNRRTRTMTESFRMKKLKTIARNCRNIPLRNFKAGRSRWEFAILPDALHSLPASASGFSHSG